MAGVELANLKASFVDGALRITDLDGNAILTINPSSGGLAIANAGGLTISTGILGGLTISTGILGGLTISTGILGGLTISTGILGGLTVSSGLTLDGVNTRTVTTAYTLVQADKGRLVRCAVDGVFITLPVASTTTLPGGTFIIQNWASSAAAQVILITATGDSIIGGGISTSNLLSNTKATAKKGDYAIVVAGGSTAAGWSVAGLVGVWASTT